MSLHTTVDDTTDHTTDHTDVERVRAAVAELAPLERDLLVLRFAHGLGTAELAARTGVTGEAVLRRLHHAAWVVEDLAGTVVAPTGRTDRDPALVEEEAGVGITPALACRLAAAVAGRPPAGGGRRRWRALRRGIGARADAVLSIALAITVVLPGVVTLVGP